MPKSNAEQTVFIITGMHRSGTSLTASILQSAGIHIGRNLLDADHVNIKGHFENIDFYEFHMNILNSQGLSSAGWTLQDNLEIKEEFIDQAKQVIEKNALSSVWGWKEPRTTLFLDFWAKLLPEARFLLIYRSPWEVADSLYRRKDEIFQTQPELAIKYWQHYNQKILNFYNQEQNRCLLTNVKTIIEYQTAYIDTINHKFNVHLSHPAPTAYDPSMLKTEVSSNSQQPTVIDYYFPEAIELYQELEGRAWHPEQTPDFSWQELLKPSLYRTWAFQDWANLRRLEQDNKSLKTQWEAQQPELQKSQSCQTELEQTKAQLKTAENLLEQSQSQLHETESVLEKSQTQLQRTESVLQQSHTQLNHTRKELEQTKTQLDQAQFDVMRYQAQLHQTQEELEYYELNRQPWEDSESKLYEAEVALSQLMKQLQQTQKREERLHLQLLQTQKELEYYEIHRQAWEDSQSKLYEAEVALSQLMKRLQKAEKGGERLHIQLHQTLEEMEKKSDQFKQKQAEIEHLQMELKQLQSQSHEQQEKFLESQSKIDRIQQRQKLEQIIAEYPKLENEMDYNLLVLDAWNAYRNRKLFLMKEHLEKALKLTKVSGSKTIVNWLETFSKLSLTEGVKLDAESLTNSEEWQQLMRQIMLKKTMPSHLIKS